MLRILIHLATAGTPVVLLAGCAPAQSAQAADREVDVATLKKALDDQKVPQLIDVRTPQEFAEGHVPGAVNIPLDQIETRSGEIASDQEVWLVCRSGSRSARAASLLEQKSFNTVNVLGGTLAWQASGFAVEK